MSILKVNGLVKSFGSQTAVDHISFTINRGEIVGFLGPNGAGKSTTMKIIAGIIYPDEGEVYINDTLATATNLNLKKSVGYLPEQNPLYSELYVVEALEFNAELHGVPNATSRIKDTIGACGLQQESHKKIKELSKGYKQRVGLAQTILHQPDLYILDEATTGLDPNQIVEIRDLIKSLGKDHAVLISTHILQEVESICHRCIVINKGKIMADDTMHSLKQKVTGNPTVKVSFATPVPLTMLQAKWQIVQKTPSSNTFIISDMDASLGQSVFKWAVQNNFVIEELIKENKNIEDVFHLLTNDEK